MENPLVDLEFPIPFDRIDASLVEPAMAALLASCEAMLARLKVAAAQA